MRLIAGSKERVLDTAGGRKTVSLGSGGVPVLGEPGDARLLLEFDEDVWHAYNMVAVGDFVRGFATRKLQSEGSTGSVSSQKVKIELSIEVQTLEYVKRALLLLLLRPPRLRSRRRATTTPTLLLLTHPPTSALSLSLRYDGEGGELRIGGVVREASRSEVGLGSHHTLTLERTREFRLSKHEWDRVAMDRLDEACNPSRSADIAAISMEPGLAHVCLITGHLTLTRARVEMTVPKKRTGVSHHTKGLEHFHDALCVGCCAAPAAPAATPAPAAPAAPPPHPRPPPPSIVGTAPSPRTSTSP